MEQKTSAERENMNSGNDSTSVDINSDENISGTQHLNDPVEEDNETESLRNELADQKDKYLRLVAEFDNFRKRTARERLDLIQTAGKDLMIPLLEVLDDLDRAEGPLKEEGAAALPEGIRLIFQKFRSTLQNRGLKAMESVGTEFDPDKHEAITELPAPEAAMKGKVLDELQKGYYLNDKIIRFAKVVVGK